MAKKTEPDLDKRMLSLTQIGVWVGVLGLMTAVILGYLQICGGSKPPPVTKETKTVIYVLDSAGNRVPKEVQGTTSTQGAVTAGSRGVTSGAKTSSGTVREEPKPAETKPAEPAKPSGEGTTTATTPEPGTFRPHPALTSLRPRPLLTNIKVIPPSGTSTATTPLKRDIRIRKDRFRINPFSDSAGTTASQDYGPSVLPFAKGITLLRFAAHRLASFSELFEGDRLDCLSPSFTPNTTCLTGGGG